jgi:hypothetical protein
MVRLQAPHTTKNGRHQLDQQTRTGAHPHTLKPPPLTVSAGLITPALMSLFGYMVSHRGGKDVPYAFGPYLVFGWVPALAFAVTSGI